MVMASMYARFEIILYGLCSYCSNNDSSSQYIFSYKNIIDMIVCEICFYYFFVAHIALFTIFYNFDYLNVTIAPPQSHLGCGNSRGLCLGIGSKAPIFPG